MNMLHRPELKPEVMLQPSPKWDMLPKYFYCNHEVQSRSVKDGLMYEVDHWRPEWPVLIEAQTGLGKTTFVFEELIPRAVAQKKNVLIISNRIALSVQQKIKLMKEINDPRLEMLSDLGIQKCEDFGAVRVITYHRLHALLTDKKSIKWRDQLLYVVADEAHFFTSDALFNRYCGAILRDITTYFGRAIRVYMTATSWDVLKPLGDAEKANYFNALGSVTGTTMVYRQFHRYIFPFDYSAYSLQFVSKLEDLTTLIQQKQKEKWLVFCNSKVKGKTFATSLGDLADYIDAEVKEEKEKKEVWQKLVKDEQFEKQVLVTTAVLDCGVNIHDESVKNIVVCADNRTSLLQMVGRKRLAPQEKVSVWIVEPTSKALSARAAKYEKQLELIQKLESMQTIKEQASFVNRLLENSDPSDNVLFYVSGTQPFGQNKGILEVRKNELAEYAIRRRKAFLDKLTSGKTTFQKEVNNWFGKITEDSVDTLELLEEFYQANEGKVISQEQIPILRNLILTLARESGYKEPQPTRVETMKHTALNNRLEKIPNASYHIEETPEKEWKLVRND